MWIIKKGIWKVNENYFNPSTNLFLPHCGSKFKGVTILELKAFYLDSQLKISRIYHAFHVISEAISYVWNLLFLLARQAEILREEWLWITHK